MNSETIYFNNLTVDTNVILVNSVDPDWASIDPAVITLSGVSVFDGDLYNLRDQKAIPRLRRAFICWIPLRLTGRCCNRLGRHLYVGVDATLIGGRATSVVFSQ